MQCPSLSGKARSWSARLGGERTRDFISVGRLEAEVDQDFLNGLGVEDREARHTATSIC